MPFCSKCGTQLSDDDRFCKKCGAPTNFEPVAAAAPAAVAEPAPIVAQPAVAEQKDDTRNATLDELDRMYDYFHKKQPQYIDLEKIPEQIEQLSQEVLPAVEGSDGKVFKIIGRIMIGAAISPGLYVALMGVGFITEQDYLIGIIIVAVYLAFLVTGIILEVNGRKRYKDYSSRQYQLRDGEIREKQERLEKSKNELEAYYREYGRCELSLAETSPMTIKKLSNIVISGEADNIKDAVNIYRKQVKEKPRTIPVQERAAIVNTSGYQSMTSGQPDTAENIMSATSFMTPQTPPEGKALLFVTCNGTSSEPSVVILNNGKVTPNRFAKPGVNRQIVYHPGQIVIQYRVDRGPGFTAVSSRYSTYSKALTFHPDEIVTMEVVVGRNVTHVTFQSSQGYAIV
ncbi:MAG: zinc ribbon domain-containing protein [Saccharofermentans sp.]|nr:zinc ribbon domain-containing protein [Saccharofermentans sp.]